MKRIRERFPLWLIFLPPFQTHFVLLVSTVQSWPQNLPQDLQRASQPAAVILPSASIFNTPGCRQFYLATTLLGIALNSAAQSSKRPSVSIPGILWYYRASEKEAGLISCKWRCLMEGPFSGNINSGGTDWSHASLHRHQAAVLSTQWSASWIWGRKIGRKKCRFFLMFFF